MSNGNRNVASLVGGVGLVLLGLLFLVLRSWMWTLVVRVAPVHLVPGLLFCRDVLRRQERRGAGHPGQHPDDARRAVLLPERVRPVAVVGVRVALLWPTAVGIGMVIQGVWGQQPRAAQTGRQLIRVGLLIFLGGLVFFELIIGIGGWGFFSPGVRAYLGPILLILAGAFVLLRHGILGARGQNANPPGRQD